MIFRRKGDKNHYDFLDADCIGRPYWSPGIYQHRGATMAGSLERVEAYARRVERGEEIWCEGDRRD